MKIYDADVFSKADEKLVNIGREVIGEAVDWLLSLYFVQELVLVQVKNADTSFLTTSHGDILI